MIYIFPRKSEKGYFSQSLRNRETIIDSIKKLLTWTPAGLTQSSIQASSHLSLILVEIPRVVQTQGTAGEESGEHEDDDDERGYDGRAGK